MEQQAVIDEQDKAEARRKAIEVTRAHIDRVRELLNEAAARLQARGFNHDRTKYDEVELGPLAEMQLLIDREGPAPFGSDEYKRRTALLGPMLEHHYANNSHHPEHYPAGVDGMDLFDLVEMFFDWKAASERNKDGAMGLTYCIEKYDIPPMLANILRNTAARLGYEAT